MTTPAPPIPPAPPPAAHPETDRDAMARSRALEGLIRDEIGREGPISFARFMELALYAPRLGYYTAGPRLGADGDFVTAPELGELFARTLARAILPVLEGIPGSGVLEAGGGSGRLAAAVLDELAACGHGAAPYGLIEISPVLRACQAATLARLAPGRAGRVTWPDEPPAGFRGVILANELLDALPVERVVLGEEGWRQVRVGVARDGLVWTSAPLPRVLEPLVRERLAPLGLPVGYVSEIGPAAEDWVRAVGSRLAQGVLLLVDYGFPRAEFYHPERCEGTLMGHHRQRVTADPLARPGLQDLTAHVEFTALAEAGVAAGLDLLGYTSQAAFLLANGIEALAREAPHDAAPPEATQGEAHRRAQEMKLLLLPQEMGELFKVLALGRDCRTILSGLRFHDRRGAL